VAKQEATQKAKQGKAKQKQAFSQKESFSRGLLNLMAKNAKYNSCYYLTIQNAAKVSTPKKPTSNSPKTA
jgi:hypothetical protein